jgi:hypothetical protein
VQVPELNVIEVAMDPYPTGERKAYEVEMLQMILAHKSLILDVKLPSYEEGEWLLAQLPQRRLCFHPLFDLSVYEALPEDTPGRDTWLFA